jgi:hypothetical protein
MREISWSTASECDQFVLYSEANNSLDLFNIVDNGYLKKIEKLNSVSLSSSVSCFEWQQVDNSPLLAIGTSAGGVSLFDWDSNKEVSI